ncbi:hypothetical protein LQL77_32725, partial [Rhodococcus cerastii]|nr:hypothetical protein [Rhodococcus cerastii]
ELRDRRADRVLFAFRALDSFLNMFLSRTHHYAQGAPLRNREGFDAIARASRATGLSDSAIVTSITSARQSSIG